MTCRETLDFLADYLSGELKDEVCAAFELHLLRCPSCVNYLNTYQQTIALGRGLADGDAAAALPEELIHAVLASQESTV
jgi:anti-sigma factor RsiW